MATFEKNKTYEFTGFEGATTVRTFRVVAIKGDKVKIEVLTSKGDSANGKTLTWNSVAIANCKEI